jgi:hypothetical protein
MGLSGRAYFFITIKKKYRCYSASLSNVRNTGSAASGRIHFIYRIGKTHAIKYFSPLFVGFLGIINTLKGCFYVEQGP